MRRPLDAGAGFPSTRTCCPSKASAIQLFTTVWQGSSDSFHPRPPPVAMALTIPASVLGLIVSGDVDGLTIYTDRYGQKIAYPKSPPDKPPSALQIIQRDRFRAAMNNWKVADAQVRADYESVSLLASLCMTGLNLWLHFSLKGRQSALTTLSRQTGITLPMPPAIA
jgi:hypothetical protein